MNIILFDQSEIKNNRVVLKDRRSQHIIKVLGSAAGDIIRTGIINGPTGTSKIIGISKGSVELLTDHNGSIPECPPTDLILALPRPIMLKRIFSQAATLGVGRIFLINANRVEKSFFSASLLQDNNFYQHLLHGLEQAVDTRVPEVTVHTRFKPFVEDVLPQLSATWSIGLVAHPGPFPLLPNCAANLQQKRTIIAIGPEGGWVDYEIEKFQEQGFLPFSMGRRILRVDTAVTALLSQIDLLRHITS